MAAGFDPAAFWGLTPRLYQVHMAGAVQRAELASNAGVAQAWLTATLTRAKTIPKLDKLLVRKPPKQARQSRQELQAMGEALAVAWGAKKVKP